MAYQRLPDTSATRHFGGSRHSGTLRHRSQDTSTPKTWYETRVKAGTLQPRTTDETQLHRWMIPLKLRHHFVVPKCPAPIPTRMSCVCAGGDQGLLNLFFSDWATKDIQRHLPYLYNVIAQSFYSYLPAFKQWVLTDVAINAYTVLLFLCLGEKGPSCVNDQCFYRAMHFSAFARSWDRMSSVCLSVCNVGDLWSHRLEI